MSGDADTLGKALLLLRAGQPAQAEKICRQLLLTEPDDFGARHLLGILLLLRGEPALAEHEIAHAVRLNPAVPGAWYNHGNALLATGRAADAVTSFDRALRLKPDMAEALCNRGDAFSTSGRANDAVASLRAALALRPDMHEAHNKLGEALLGLGEPGEALASFDRAIALAPTHASALNNRGRALLETGRNEEALAAFRDAIGAAPELPEPHDNLGLALQELGRFEEAVACHDAAIARNPGFTTAYIRRAMAQRRLGCFEPALRDCNQAIALQPKSARGFDARGIVHNDMGCYQEALQDYREAIALDPGFAHAYNNLGNVLYDLGRMDEALLQLQKAIELKPVFPEAYCNLGLVLQDTRRLDAALLSYDTAIALREGYAEAYKRRATLRLLQGDYRQGWEDYETNLFHARRHASSPLQDIPYWTGQPLRGKSILLSEPNGLGDTIQFWRFLPLLAAMGARVSFLGLERMFRLLRSSPWRVRLLSERPAGEEFDYRCELWSLPHLLRAELDCLPGGIPYMAADPEAIERCAQWLRPGVFNIGVCWQGNPSRKIDAGRSIPLAAFHPLAKVPGVRLVSLQKNFGLEQLDELPPGMSVTVPGPGFDAGPDAFADTAGLMMGLDLVVTSDTSLAHLAGALGRPTWVGIKYAPEWRWMLDRSDSPWYPTLRVFRQPMQGDWSGAFDEMAAELKKLAG